MFEDETKEPAPKADDTAEQNGLENDADSAGQVSEITTESPETQAEAAEQPGLIHPASEVMGEVPGNTGKSVQTFEQKGLLHYVAPDFANPEEALQDHQKQVNKSLLINEDLMMTYLFRDNISESYYKLWRDDANLYFRNLCIFRHRLARGRAKQKARNL